MRKNRLILLAAGSGERMGGTLPKQFLEFDGKCILHHTLERFLEAIPGLEVTVVLNRDYFQYWKDYCRLHNVIVKQHLVAGGITRFHSVANALKNIPEGEIVAVHDGVRPFASVQMIRKAYNLAQEYPAVIPVVPCTDSIKLLDAISLPDGSYQYQTVEAASVDRSRLFGAQTPQVFQTEVLKAAYELPFDISFTDDASVVQKNGTRLHYLEGERLNIKITTPEDLVLARAITSLENE